MSAQNFNEGKFRPSLVVGDMAQAFCELVKVREAGAVKYDRMNWAESIGTDDAERFLDENVDSMFRHIISYMGGEKIDPESGCHHLAHVGVRAMFGVEYDKAPEDTPLDSGDFEEGEPTYRDQLKRGHEMPYWLIEMIKENDEPRYQFYSEGDELVSGLFAWGTTQQGQDFWTKVEQWQSLRRDRLPEQPKEI